MVVHETSVAGTSLAGIRAVLLDLDDTLVIETECIAACFADAADLGASVAGVDPAQLAPAARRAASRRWQEGPGWDWAERVGMSSWEALWCRFEGPGQAELRTWSAGFRPGIWADALGAQGVADDGLAEALGQRFASCRRASHRVYDDVRPLLAVLRGSVRIGLLSNGDSALQREKLDGAGLSEHFDAVLMSGDVGVGKPGREPYEEVLSRLGVPASAALMVGDNPVNDVEGALAAGLRAAWLERSGERPGQPSGELTLPAGALRIRSLAELPALLE